jgi:hypothetical protein
MIAVIFEVCPHAHTRQDYLALAASLAPLLSRIDGFLSIERFQSLSQPEKSCRCRSGATKRRCKRGAIPRNTARRSRKEGPASSPGIGCALRRSSAIMA